MTSSSRASLEQITQESGVYLRLAARERSGPGKRFAKRRAQSLHDGFTSCLFVRATRRIRRRVRLAALRRTASPGLLCNEWDVCAPPPVPYNMRLAYRALRVLSTEWTDELHQTDERSRR